jgi:D-glycero-D-manno-heptose 1,7-bisphosphate phosphatase
MGDRSAMKLVILDRDGTINEDRDDYVKSPEEWVPIPGALEAIARLHQAGWHVVIASNQSGLGRGLFDMGTLNAMHLKMNELLAPLGGRVDAVFFCPHAPEDHCNCRKPLPGLFEQIGRRYGIDLTGAPAVGDTLRDLQASTAVGCAPHLVRTGKAADLDEAGLDALRQRIPGLVVHANLAAFADSLLSAEKKRQQEARRAAQTQHPQQQQQAQHHQRPPAAAPQPDSAC